MTATGLSRYIDPSFVRLDPKYIAGEPDEDVQTHQQATSSQVSYQELTRSFQETPATEENAPEEPTFANLADKKAPVVDRELIPDADHAVDPTSYWITASVNTEQSASDIMQHCDRRFASFARHSNPLTEVAQQVQH